MDYWAMAQHMTFWQLVGGRAILIVVLLVVTLLSGAIVTRGGKRTPK
jgi:hypothetical protein